MKILTFLVALVATMLSNVCFSQVGLAKAIENKETKTFQPSSDQIPTGYNEMTMALTPSIIAETISLLQSKGFEVKEGWFGEHQPQAAPWQCVAVTRSPFARME